MKLKYVGHNGCVYDAVMIPVPTGGEIVVEAHKPFSIDDETGRGLLAGGAYEEVVPEKKVKEEPKAEAKVEAKVEAPEADEKEVSV